MAKSKLCRSWTLEAIQRERTEEEGNCWLWTGAMGGPKKETPNMWFKGKVKAAYVATWLLLKGLDEVPEGLSLWRGCQNMRCVNPHCLLTGSVAKKSAWLTAHGAYKASPARRAAITVRARASCARLSGGLDEARQIRQSTDSDPVIAARHGISVSRVNRIRNHKAWTESVIPTASIFSMGGSR